MKFDCDELARRLKQVQQLEGHLSFRLTRLSKHLEQHGQKLLTLIHGHLIGTYGQYSV